MGKRRREGKRLIFVSNHFAVKDVFLLALHSAGRFIRFIPKKEIVENNPFMASLVKGFEAVPIDRGKPDITAIKKILNLIKKDKPVGIFAEGTRNKTGEILQELLPGAVMFALKGKAEIQPSVFCRKARLCRLNYALCGDPINFGELYDRKIDSEVLAEANAILRERMLELITVVRFYAKSPTKIKITMRKDLNNPEIKIKDIMTKYGIEKLPTTITS